MYNTLNINLQQMKGQHMAEIATEQDAWEFISIYGIGFFKQALIGGVYQRLRLLAPGASVCKGCFSVSSVNFSRGLLVLGG